MDWLPRQQRLLQARWRRPRSLVRRRLAHGWLGVSGRVELIRGAWVVGVVAEVDEVVTAAAAAGVRGGGSLGRLLWV